MYPTEQVGKCILTCPDSEILLVDYGNDFYQPKNHAVTTDLAVIPANAQRRWLVIRVVPGFLLIRTAERQSR